ncbi:hypothetical protein N7G274_010122 [Stereocaulon virgatum]|uniref:MYND-type domain-containing protein n=1 Tax=Stereocaulon virgatum TaxID=373712 RepID=A0ABR3ZWL4_9LECA
MNRATPAIAPLQGYDSGQFAYACARCTRTEGELGRGFKCCGVCKTTRYCSILCTQDDKPLHDRVCGHSINDSLTQAELRVMEVFAFQIENPQSLNLRDAADHLIGCFMFRSIDDWNFLRVAMTYPAGFSDVIRHAFGTFLRFAEFRNGLLPPYWSSESRASWETTK